MRRSDANISTMLDENGRAVNKRTDLPEFSQTLHFDVDRYQEFLDNSNLSAGQKEEILKALWVIVVCFVDLGFDINPPQETHKDRRNEVGTCA